ncbi:MAG: flippase-like domain-containing protein [Flavobacteriales bacterium]|nr:flippase-like domain-containing protein [Flavobacteriales bacterium]
MQRSLLFLLRWCVFALACGYVYRQWHAYESTADATFPSFVSMGPWYLLPPLVGIAVNWGLETLKWRLMMRDVQHFSFRRAFAAVLAGCGISLITPNRTGEFIGRVLFVAPEKRIEASVLSVLASLSQLVVTLACGALAGLVWWWSGWPALFAAQWSMGVALLLATCISVVVWLVLSHPGWLRARLLTIRPLQHWRDHLDALNRLPLLRVVAVQALSLLRYLVFVAQFACLLHGFGAGLSTGVLTVALPVIYLLATLVPTVMFTELGVRAGTSVLVLGSLGADERAVTLAASLLWTMNVLLPAVAGSVVLLLARIRMSRSPA